MKNESQVMPLESSGSALGNKKKGGIGKSIFGNLTDPAQCGEQ